MTTILYNQYKSSLDNNSQNRRKQIVSKVNNINLKILFLFGNLEFHASIQNFLIQPYLHNKSEVHYIRGIHIKRRKHTITNLQSSKILPCPEKINIEDLIIHELMSSKQVMKGGQVRRFYRYISHEFFMSDNISLSCNFERYISLKFSYL